jgi:hypothetical protein
MSGYTAFADVGDTLRKLLWESIKVDSRIYPDIVSSEDDLSMLSPEEMREGDSKKLSIFLYQITECPYLKNQEMEQTGSTNLKQIPLASILYYLVTPNTDDRRKDHVLLGKVMQILYDNATIRGSILQGALGGTREELRVTLHPLPFEELASLWQSFHETSFRLSVAYQVTPVRIDSARISEVRRVVQKEVTYYQVPVGHKGQGVS